MKIIWSGIGITDARGKIGGQVMSKNRSGAFARTLVQGNNPQTGYQVAARARYSQALGDWLTLSTLQQDDWIAAAASGSWNTVDSLGQVVVPTGQQLFVRVNLAVDASLQPVFAVPALPSLTPLNVNDFGVQLTGASLSKFLVEHDETTIPAGREVVIWSTGGLSPGIRRPRQSAFKQIARVNKAAYDAALGDIDLITAYNARLSLPLIGQRVYISLEIGDTASGRRIEYYRSDAIVS